jgi:hypothetical protein
MFCTVEAEAALNFDACMGSRVASRAYGNQVHNVLLSMRIDQA